MFHTDQDIPNLLDTFVWNQDWHIIEKFSCSSWFGSVTACIILQCLPDNSSNPKFFKRFPERDLQCNCEFWDFFEFLFAFLGAWADISSSETQGMFSDSFKIWSVNIINLCRAVFKEFASMHNIYPLFLNLSKKR